jgi:hypothetical protein
MYGQVKHGVLVKNLNELTHEVNRITAIQSVNAALTKALAMQPPCKVFQFQSK